jgi:hypothetical protein
MFALNQLTAPKPVPGIPLDSYSEAAPEAPPGSGLRWQRNTDKSWTLVPDESGSCSDLSLKPFTEDMKFAFHVVSSQDTLEGVCLKYHCRPLDIRRMNGISGDNIQMLRLLKIRECERVAEKEDKEASREEILREFMSETGEGRAEAEFYLEGQRWRIELALADWKNDDEAASSSRL